MVCAVGFFSCAHQIAPGGGPLDKTPPASVSSVPPPYALQCKDIKKISIIFSEWIDPATARGAVSFSPKPVGGFVVEVSAKTLMITPASALKPNYTYHVEVGSGLKDIHGVALAGSYRLVFSTGATLDSGKIAGCLGLKTMSSRQRYRISLFYADSVFKPESLFTATPDYITETDSMGAFTFENIRKGQYALVGIMGSASLKNASNEGVAPSRELVSSDGSHDPVFLFPVSAEHTKARCTDFRLIDSHHGVARLSRALGPQWRDTVRAADISITGLDTTSRARARVVQTELLSSKDRWFITFDSVLTRGSYRIIINHHDTTLFTRADTIRFNGAQGADTIPSTIRYVGPTRNVRLLAQLTFVSDKILHTMPQKITAIDTTGDSVVCMRKNRGKSDSLTFVPQKRFRTDRTYTVKLNAQECLDGASRAADADSNGMAAVVVFKTLAATALCNSMSGSAPCLSQSNYRTWIFTPLGFADPLYCKDSAATFRFDSIPASKGTLSYFEDYDGNGIPTTGMLFPFLAPEPLFTTRDTIEARARWDVTGVLIPECATCIQKSMAPVKKPVP